MLPNITIVVNNIYFPDDTHKLFLRLDITTTHLHSQNETIQFKIHVKKKETSVDDSTFVGSSKSDIADLQEWRVGV